MGHVTDLSPRTQLVDAAGGTTVYAYNFLLTDAADLVVEQTDALTGAVTVLLLSTDYTVAGLGVSSGGTITLTTGTLINDVITMERDIAIERLNDYPTGGDFAAVTVNAEQDEVFMIAQQQERDIGRSMRLQTSDTSVDMLLPLKADRASKFFVYDAAGNPSTSNGTGTDNALRTDLSDSSDTAKGDALIGGKRTAAGAVSFTGHSYHENRTFNVKTDFAAVGDGVTDDTISIQNAINSLTNGGTLYFPQGTYKTTAELIGDSYIEMIGDGVGATTIIQTGSGVAAISWTDKTRFSLKNMTISGNNADAVIVKITNGTVEAPIFEDILILGWGASSSGLLFDVSSNFAMLFPVLRNVELNGGGAAPNVDNRIGLNFGGAGSTLTVSPKIFAGRITNCLIGMNIDTAESIRCFGTSFDGITNGSSGGKAILMSAATAAHRLESIRFESTLSIDIFVDFGASRDNFISGNFANVTPAKMLDSGARNETVGSDQSGGYTDRLANPITISGVLLKFGDIDAVGGYRQLVGYIRSNVAANLTNDRIDTVAGAGFSQIIVMSRSGSVTGISINSSTQRTAGTLTAKVGVNTATTNSPVASLDATNKQYHYATINKDTMSFAAGDALEVQITTDATWAPTTADILVQVEFEA